MAHTYNEQVLTIPAGGTLEETAGLIRAGIAQLTGWTQDSEQPEYLNITPDKKLRFRVYVSGSYIYCRAYFNKTKKMTGSSDSSSQWFSNINTTFRCWKSTGETVTWLGCDQSNNAYWLIAKNSEDRNVIFQGNLEGSSVVGADALAEQRGFYYRTSSQYTGMPRNTNNISIAQFADVWNGGSFPELFWVYGIADGYASNNMHVAFGDKTYAIVKMHNNTPSQLIFAFPVSNE